MGRRARALLKVGQDKSAAGMSCICGNHIMSLLQCDQFSEHTNNFCHNTMPVMAWMRKPRK